MRVKLEAPNAEWVNNGNSIQKAGKQIWKQISAVHKSNDDNRYN